MSIYLLSCIGMVAVVPTSSLGCGFAFAFDLDLFVALDLVVDLQEFLYCLDLNRPHI